MTLDEALSKAVIGYHVRHDGMKPSDYVDYNFDGFKINDKSLFYPDEADKVANWRIANESISAGQNWDTGAVDDEIVDEPFSIVPAIEGWQ